jgi:hypothetical protein
VRPDWGLRSDPSCTAARIRRLESYMDRSVLSPSREFICRHYDECLGSIRPGDLFREGLLSHVGHHYDLTLEGKALRVVVVGQEYGMQAPEGGQRPRRRVSLRGPRRVRGVLSAARETDSKGRIEEASRSTSKQTDGSVDRAVTRSQRKGVTVTPAVHRSFRPPEIPERAYLPLLTAIAGHIAFTAYWIPSNMDPVGVRNS